MSMENKIKTLGALNAKSFHAELDEVGRDNGEKALRIVIRHPSAVVVIPVTDEGRAVVVRQFRYALGRETVEFPAGKLDPGEDPAQAAARELAEESGFAARRLDRLLSFAPSSGYSDEVIHVFVARGLEPLAERPDELEISGVETMEFSRLKEMIGDGRVDDGSTIVALAAYEWLAPEA